MLKGLKQMFKGYKAKFNFVKERKWQEMHCLKSRIENKEKLLFSVQEEVQ